MLAARECLSAIHKHTEKKKEEKGRRKKRKRESTSSVLLCTPWRRTQKDYNATTVNGREGGRGRGGGGRKEEGLSLNSIQYIVVSFYLSPCLSGGGGGGEEEGEGGGGEKGGGNFNIFYICSYLISKSSFPAHRAGERRKKKGEGGGGKRGD